MVRGHNFEELKKIWDKKLEENGLHDIESEVQAKTVRRISDKYPVQRHATRDYYLNLTQIIHDPNTKFRNETDRYILEQYAEGTWINTIVEELKRRNTPKGRYAIRIMIRRYEMAWGMRSYTRKELHLK